VERVTLCDYDASVVAVGRSELSRINEGSFDDPRLEVVIDDAWNFVRAACRDGERFHLIVSDFTVAQNVEGAALHSIEWYELMRSALVDGGVLAVNAVSPSATPEAYWSVYNSMRAVGLRGRPYRIALPSFCGAGYGADWGFIASVHAERAGGERSPCGRLGRARL
jgi:spermidine synthase